MPRTLNMQRVAEAAGVSKSSVSLALRDDPRLAPETRRRVQEIASRMGYRKNPIIASLMAQLRVSHTPKFHANFALINCSSNRMIFDSPTFAEFRRGIREHADKAGYGVDEFWTEEPGVRLERLRQILHARNIKGLILAATNEPRTLFPGHPEFLREFCFAVVGVDRTEPLLPRAANNHFHTARSAVEIALRHGYARPGLVLVDGVDRQLDRRFSAGFRAGMHDASPANNGHTSPLLFQQPDRAVFAKWLKSERPDAILTDQSVVLDWLRELKISVPADIGLIHLDWMPQLRDWAGMNQNNRLVGAAVADLVIGQMTRNEVGPPDHPNLVLIESDFVAGPSLKSSSAASSRPAAGTPLVRAGAIVTR